VLASLVIVPAMAVLSTDNPLHHVTGALIGGIAYAGGLAATLIIYELIVHKEGWAWAT